MELSATPRVDRERRRPGPARRLLVATVVILAGLAALAIALPAPLNQARTLLSLRQVDDYPLYVLRYYGGYGAAGYPSAGSRQAAAATGGATQAGKWACTCFGALNPAGDMLMGRNFDWYNHAALLLYTDPPDGYASVSLVDLGILGASQGQGLTWGERLVLLSAPYAPIDGMNECGVAVGMMAVDQATPSFVPGRATVGSLEAIRLLLDHAQDVDEAVTLLGSYNLSFGGGPPLHYLIADRSGRSAVVEFVRGEMVVLRNEEPWQVSTNFLLATSRPEGAHSGCWRYNRAYEVLQGAEGRLAAGEAVDLLQAVSQDITMWSAVYGLTTGEVRVAMGRRYDQVHLFRLPLAE